MVFNRKIIVTYDGEFGEEDVDYTKDIEPFCPTYLGHCQFLMHLDISGCSQFDADLFTASVVQCKRLKKIALVSCLQFSEVNLMVIFKALLMLEDIDCSGCSKIKLANARTTAEILQKLSRFMFEPKFPFTYHKEWDKFLNDWKYITFSPSVGYFSRRLESRR